MQFTRVIFTCVLLLLPSTARSQHRREATIREAIADAKFIAFGRADNARKVEDSSATDLIILETIREHPDFKGAKTVIMAGWYLAATDPKKPRHVVAGANRFTDKWDFYCVIDTEAGGAAYVRGILKLDTNKPRDLARFYLGYVGDPNPAIRKDAFLELTKVANADLNEAARELSADSLRAIFRNDKLELYERDLAAALLSVVGKEEDADELYKLAGMKNGLQGCWLAVLSLKPKTYLPRAKEVAADMKSTFLNRYAILKAADRLYEMKNAPIPRSDLISLVEAHLVREDFADYAIERLRKWKHWEPTERILGMYDKKPYDRPGMRKAILRYALQAPGPEAAAFVAKMRKLDAEWVAETKELLELESGPSPK